MVTALTLVFITFGLLFFGVAFFGFIWHISQASKDRAVKREIALRFYPDRAGNYPQALYQDGSQTNFQPGNNPYFQPHFIIQPAKSEVIPALPGRPEVEVKVYGEPAPAQLPTTQEEVIAYLVEAKNRGLTKTEALKSLGITGGRSFTKYAKHFDALP